MASSSKRIDKSKIASASHLAEFLRGVRATDKSHTHVLLGSPFGNFSIGSPKMAEFWNLYLEERDRNTPIYLAEAPGKELPILVDVDLKARKSVLKKDLESGEHLYSESQLKEVIDCYQTFLKKIVVDIKPEALTCVLLEKDWYEQMINGVCYVKNGFHLHFPKLFLDKRVQEVYLIPLVKKKLDALFDNLGAKDFIDANSVNVHWLMYGAKKPNNDPYVATRCFTDGCVETSFEDALGDYKLAPVKGFPTTPKSDVMRLFPRIMSIFLYGREKDYYYKPQPSVNTPIMDIYAQRKEKRTRYRQGEVFEQLEEARRLIDLFDKKKRSDDRSDWLAIGFCIWNICNGDADGLSLWLDFSEHSDKYDESECLHIWDNMHPNEFTIGTLKFFAKQDSPEKFESIIQERYKSLLFASIDGCHTDIAKLLHIEYGNEFVCSSPETKTWYQFRNHIWRISERGVDLRERISSETGVVLSSLNEYIEGLKEEQKVANSKREEEEDTDDKKSKRRAPAPKKDEYDIKIQKIKGLIKSCKMTPFKNNVMTECVDVFRNEEFQKILNVNPNLVAFKNGVYDFSNDIFRDGKPEDFLSVAIPINYVDYGSVDHPKVMEIAKFFRKIFPDEEIRNYFLDQACQLFVGGNPEKVVLFWTGSGDNGKSITQTLIEKMLGLHSLTCSTSLLTGKKPQMGIASPELARAGDGARAMFLYEPNNDELISAGVMKGLSGNDRFFARDLYEKGKATREIVPLFKLFLICNTLPGIRDGDAATWNRIRVVPFESKFVPASECSDNEEVQMYEKRFPMDMEFSSKLDEMTQPLAWFLIQRWRKFNRRERVIPEQVKIATELYKKENDAYAQYVESSLSQPDEEVKNGKTKKRLPFATVCSHFKNWYRMEFPGQPLPNKTMIKNKLESILGELDRQKCWVGVSIIGDGDELESIQEDRTTTRNLVNPMLN